MKPYRVLWHRFVLWVRRSLSFLWLAVVAAYLIVVAGQAIYRNYQSQQEIKQMKQKLITSQVEEERLQALLVYYQTDSFKEKELRRSLLVKKPSERMLALPESSAAATVEEDVARSSVEQNQPKRSTLPLWRQWVDYLWFDNGSRT